MTTCIQLCNRYFLLCHSKPYISCSSHCKPGTLLVCIRPFDCSFCIWWALGRWAFKPNDMDNEWTVIYVIIFCVLLHGSIFPFKCQMRCSHGTTAKTIILIGVIYTCTLVWCIVIVWQTWNLSLCPMPMSIIQKPRRAMLWHRHCNQYQCQCGYYYMKLITMSDFNMLTSVYLSEGAILNQQLYISPVASGTWAFVRQANKWCYWAYGEQCFLELDQY